MDAVTETKHHPTTEQAGSCHANGQRHETSAGTAVHATIHCLTGCVIGEVAGLMIGVSLGLHPFATIALAVVLAYISGFTLALYPLMSRENLSLAAAMRVIWLGEAVSIAVMEIAMNGVDYAIGGVQAGSIFAPIFWYGMLAAIPAGFIAAFPVNYWLLKKELKACH